MRLRTLIVQSFRAAATVHMLVPLAWPRSTAARLLREADAELATWTHPDPYVVPYMPGGSKFMRNPPPPLSLVFPHGVPPEYDIAPQTVHYVQVRGCMALFFRHPLQSPFVIAARGPDATITCWNHTVHYSMLLPQVPLSATPEGMTTILIDPMTKSSS